MQFQDYLANECKNPERYNCMSCDDDFNCLKKGKFEIETFMRDSQGKRIKKSINSAQDLWDYFAELSAYNIKEHNPLPISEFEIFLAHNICPIPFIDPEIIEAVNMVDLAGKINPENYLDMPAALCSIIKIVNGERNRLQALRMKSG